ncbi:hypothetical protein ACF9IK_31935 [Kitasatospora hibisci]|uniref:hypothetical protein n=1 Tax=Kitasatospora hibisci TaxID=3369522 RepID=UPI003754B272
MTFFAIHKRRLGSLVAVAGAAVLTAGTGVAAGADASVQAAPVPAAAVTRAAAAPVAAPVAAKAGGVQTVAPGERLTAGGATLWLTPQGLSVVAPKFSGTDKPDVTRVADVRPGKVTSAAWGDASGTLWAGIFRGPVSDSTKITIRLGDRTLDAKVVTLAGRPGWGAFYAFDTQKTDASAKPAVTVQS